MKNCFTLAGATSNNIIPRLRHFTGVTLAEVLITIGIIGVVAALTIPSLITNYQKLETVTKLKKIYSDLQTLILQYDNEFSCDTNLGNCAPESMQFEHTFAEYLINKHNFKLIKPYMPDNFYIKYYDFYGEQKTNMHWQGGYVLQPASGAYIISVGQNGSNQLGNAYFSGMPYQSPATKIRCEIVIFTNPNSYYKEKARIGKNIFFAFVAQNERLLPGGSPYCYGNGHRCLSYKMYNSCDLNAKGGYMSDGYGCFQKIIDDGWKIKYY